MESAITYIPIQLQNDDVECSALPPVIGQPLHSKKEVAAFLRIALGLGDDKEPGDRKIAVKGKDWYAGPDYKEAEEDIKLLSRFELQDIHDYLGGECTLPFIAEIDVAKTPRFMLLFNELTSIYFIPFASSLPTDIEHAANVLNYSDELHYGKPWRRKNTLYSVIFDCLSWKVVVPMDQPSSSSSLDRSPESITKCHMPLAPYFVEADHEGRTHFDKWLG